MPSINVSLGDAFWLYTDRKTCKHLYIVIAQTAEDKFLFVNSTTHREGKSENTCILDPTEEDMPSTITEKSVIAYGYAREFTVGGLRVLARASNPIPVCSFPPAILSRIQQGGIRSKLLDKDLKAALRSFLNC